MNRVSRSDMSAFTRRGQAWSEATELAQGSYRVRLGGAFQGSWMATLSRRLAERQLSIDHTHARLGNDQIWIAELHLLALSVSATDPLAVDYVALAEDADPLSQPSFEIDSYRLIESRDYGGTLMLTLEAPDSLGLLGWLLGALAQLELVPIELHIETRSGRAYDSLWLRGTAERAPSAEARDAAAHFLESARR